MGKAARVKTPARDFMEARGWVWGRSRVLPTLTYTEFRGKRKRPPESAAAKKMRAWRDKQRRRK